MDGTPPRGAEEVPGRGRGGGQRREQQQQEGETVWLVSDPIQWHWAVGGVRAWACGTGGAARTGGQSP